MNGDNEPRRIEEEKEDDEIDDVIAIEIEEGCKLDDISNNNNKCNVDAVVDDVVNENNDKNDDANETKRKRKIIPVDAPWKDRMLEGK
jgi:hypothetical protein